MPQLRRGQVDSFQQNGKAEEVEEDWECTRLRSLSSRSRDLISILSVFSCSALDDLQAGPTAPFHGTEQFLIGLPGDS